jgi:tetratricopeptide (TPR) repeat protein
VETSWLEGLRWAGLGCRLLVWTGFTALVSLARPAIAVVPDSELAAAIDLYEARNYSEARPRFELAVAQYPESCDVLFYLGRIALWFDEAGAGLRHLEKAAQLAPQSARIQNALGDAYGLAAKEASLLTKLRWANKCRTAYERAVELEPENPAFHWSLLGFYIVAPRIAGGGFEKAEARVAEIARLDPMNGRVARATLALAERRFEAAFAEFEGVLRDSPDDFIALYQIGRCAALSGRDPERGIRALQRCLTLPEPRGDGLPSHAGVHYRLGNLLEMAGDAPGAKREYALALQKHPDFRPEKVQLKN